jgi:hypothetical protein
MSKEREKLGATLRFRVSPSFAAKVTKLVTTSKWSESEILRTGLELFWADIEAHVLAQAGHHRGIPIEVARKIRELEKLGLDPVAILTDAAQAALTAEATPAADPAGYAAV